jgi:phosphate transport system substrate-binding protein
MKRTSQMVLALAALSAAAVPAYAQMRRNIRIVGSSTVYPFAKAVAEHFSRANPGVPAPIVESTGTGAGFKLFCAGVGAGFPDMTNASRRIKLSEFRSCAANGVSQVTEIAVGLDGIAVATARATELSNLEGRQRQVPGGSDPHLRPTVHFGHALVDRGPSHGAWLRHQSCHGGDEEAQ